MKLARLSIFGVGLGLTGCIALYGYEDYGPNEEATTTNTTSSVGGSATVGGAGGTTSVTVGGAGGSGGAGGAPDCGVLSGVGGCSPMPDFDNDPFNCGECGHGCLDSGCNGGRCQSLHTKDGYNYVDMSLLGDELVVAEYDGIFLARPFDWTSVFAQNMATKLTGTSGMRAVTQSADAVLWLEIDGDVFARDKTAVEGTASRRLGQMGFDSGRDIESSTEGVIVLRNTETLRYDPSLPDQTPSVIGQTSTNRKLVVYRERAYWTYIGGDGKGYLASNLLTSGPGTVTQYAADQEDIDALAADEDGLYWVAKDGGDWIVRHRAFASASPIENATKKFNGRPSRLFANCHSIYYMIDQDIYRADKGIDVAPELVVDANEGLTSMAVDDRAILYTAFARIFRRAH